MSLIARELDRLGLSDHQAVCANPSTPPDVLARLVPLALRYPDPLGITLAGNPAIPIESLVLMIRVYALKVSLNPTFKICLATDPNFIDSMSRYTQARLARCEGMDERLIRILAGSRSRSVHVRVWAARNPTCPSAMLKDFVCGGHAWAVRQSAAQNSNLPPELQRILARDPRKQVVEAVAERIDILPDVIELLSQPDQPARVRRALARNRKIPADILDRMLETGPKSVKDIILRQRGLLEEPLVPLKV